MIPLVVRSHYSLMWGTASPRQICRAARRMGYARLALTDTDNLYGLWPFLAACRNEGITPIVGAEVTDPVRRRARFVTVVCLATPEPFLSVGQWYEDFSAVEDAEVIHTLADARRLGAPD